MPALTHPLLRLRLALRPNLIVHRSVEASWARVQARIDAGTHASAMATELKQRFLD
jgi:hypothetical protein